MCDPGKYLNDPSDATICTDCQEGTYSSFPGATQLLGCDAGKFGSSSMEPSLLALVSIGIEARTAVCRYFSRRPSHLEAWNGEKKEYFGFKIIIKIVPSC